jgi:hypothetical protein
MRSFLLGLILLSAHLGAEVRKMHFPVSHQVIHEYGGEMEQEFGLTMLTPLGGGPYTLTSFGCGFRSHRHLSVGEVRAIMVPMIDRLQEQINGSEALRPYLAHHPFGLIDLEFKISFIGQSGSKMKGEEVAYASLINGDLCYSTWDPKVGMLSSLGRESFEDAKKALESKVEQGQ